MLERPQFKVHQIEQGQHTKFTFFVRQPPSETWQNAGSITLSTVVEAWTMFSILERGGIRPIRTKPHGV